MARPVTDAEMIGMPLPDLRIAESKTISSSIQLIEWKGNLVYWSTFEQEVRQIIDQQVWSNRIMAYKGQGNHSSYLDIEHFRCGDELSVQGRFAHHVGRVMNGTFKVLGMDLAFGDFKTGNKKCVSSTRVPDIVLVACPDTYAENVLVGEVKTPWKHDFHSNCIAAGQAALRRYLGQIARYMATDLELKYGFVTCYDQTIFVKFEQIPGREPELYYSHVIRHSTPSQRVLNPNSPADYFGRVSLRECFLYLAHQTCPLHNSMHRHRFISKEAKRLTAPRKKSFFPPHFVHYCDGNIASPYIPAPPPMPALDFLRTI